jgi:hypothetical protein
MQLAYVDDSGDHYSFALAAVIVPAAQWLQVHDRLRDFRSRLSKERNFRMRYEVKATQLVSGGGKWHALNINQHTRFGIYKAALRELADMAPIVRTVAVVVPDRNDPRLFSDPLSDAWEVLLSRLERYCFTLTSPCLLLADEGTPASIRAMARRKRRFGYAPAAFGGPARKVPFNLLVDDPVIRVSQESYLMQWADLAAYAAFRTVMPRPEVPPRFWDELGPAVLGEANEITRRRGSGEPPGVVIWPRPRQAPVVQSQTPRHQAQVPDL